MKFSPLGDRVLVRPTNATQVTPGGVIIPETAQERPMEGVVVASGPGKVENGKLIPNSVKEGDVVIYGKWSGSEVTIEGERFMIMEESQILGVVTA